MNRQSQHLLARQADVIDQPLHRDRHHDRRADQMRPVRRPRDQIVADQQIPAAELEPARAHRGGSDGVGYDDASIEARELEVIAKRRVRDVRAVADEHEPEFVGQR